MRVESKTSSRRKFLTDTAVFALVKGVVTLRWLIILPVFARAVNAEGYGIFSQILATMTLLVPFASFRMEVATVRFLATEDDIIAFRGRFYAALVLITLASLVVSILLVAFAPIGAIVIFGRQDYVDVVMASSLLLITWMVSEYLRNYFRVTHRMNTMSVVLFVQSVLETVMVLLAVYFGYGVNGAIWALTGVKSIFIIGLLMAIVRQLGWFSFNWQGLWEMLSYSIPLMPNSIMGWAINYADRIVIAHFLGITMVGIYSASYSLSSILGLLLMPVAFVLFPTLSRLWDAKEIDEVRRYFFYVTRYYLFLALPACVGLALVSQHLLGIVATSEFITDRFLVFWIAVGIMLNGLFQINVYVFHLVRNTKYVTWIMLISVLLNLCLNIVLVPLIGLTGSAIATALAFLLMAVLAFVYGQRLIGYRLNWLDIGKSAIASIGMAICLFWWPVESFLSIIGLAVLGGCVYIVLLLILQVFSATEKLYMRRLVLSVWNIYFAFR